MNEAERDAGLAPTPGYRYADVVGDELFIAGQVPHGVHGALVGPGVEAQADRCLTNLFRLIDVHGFEREHIRRLVVYVVGDDLAAAWGRCLLYTSDAADDVRTV